jgi:beta-lactam-binding protein with PASTA domain
MKKRPVANFFQVASLVMLLIAVAMLAAIATMHFAIHGAEVQVPALQGMTVADARSQAAGLELTLDVDNRYYSGEVAAGHILTQSPPAGTIVRAGRSVRVAESLGPQKVDVPDTVGKDQRVAALTLRRVGLEVGTTAQMPWSRAPEGTVLAQDPPAHAQGISRPAVNLLVAAPDDESADGFVMPDLVGLPVVTAQAQLVKVGIKPPLPTYVAVPVAPVGIGSAPLKPPVKPGSVIAQTPPSGSRVYQNASITLTVAQ